MTEDLGRASLRLEADLAPFEKNMREAESRADEMRDALEALTAVSKVSEAALKNVKMSPGQGAESKGSAESIVSGVRGVSEEARTAARELDKVKLTSAQAAESTAAGDVIDRKLKDVTGNANEARRALESVRLASAGNPGAGVGVFGSGFGRIGVLGTAVGAGVLTAPAAAPAALGALAAIPALSAAAAGSIGTLALAFDGVGKAIGGDKTAFDDLGPAAQQFTLTVRSLDGELDKLRQTAGAALFPGLTEALRSALSPGTLAAVTNAIKEFGVAIGQAGAQWGRYFGSTEFQSIFVPLMHAGAHEMTVMSAAVLALFDAFGVLGRAAIPFTNWLVSTIDHGAKFVDTWLHAKDATGQLGQAMNEAKTSLEIVGRLFGSLVNVVLALGGALYPVSKIAVKDLTDGLNALAGIIKRNQNGIRDFVSGALSALVATVKTAWPIVQKLAQMLNAVVHAMGGWKGAFELVIGGFLALKFVALAKTVASVGLAAEGAAGEAVGLRAALLGLGAPEVLFALAAVAAALKLIDDYRSHHTVGHAQTGGDAKLNTEVFEQGGKYYERTTVGRNVVTKEITAAQAKKIVGGGVSTTVGPGSAHSGAGNVGPGVVSGSGDFTDESAAMKAALSNLAKRYGPINLTSGYRSEAKQTALWDASVKAGHPGFMPDGNPIARPASRGGAGSDHSRGTAADGTIFYKGKWIPLSSLPPSVLAAYGLGTVPGDTGHVMLTAGGGTTTSPFGEVPPFTSNLGPKPPKPVIPSGANLLPEALRNALQRAKDRATTTQGATAAHWLAVELDDLDKARKSLDAQLKSASGKKKANIQQEIRAIDGQIASVNRQITVNLHAQASAIKAAFAAKISTAKANINSAVDALKSSLDAALGAQFFQGGQTPLEKQLADMQAADTVKSLEDALAQAQASGDPVQIEAAQRAITENNLAIAAAAERAKADRDYADAQKDLNLQITMWARGIATGATKLGDLNGIVAGFGLTLTGDAGVVAGFAKLQGAVKDLADVLIAEAQALGGVGDDTDAQAAAARAAALSIPAGAPTLIPGTNIDYAGFVAASLARNLPSLDVGGTVLETGLAVVHRGETYSGVGGAAGSGFSLTVNGNLIQERDLQTTIVRALEEYVRNGGRPIAGLATAR